MRGGHVALVGAGPGDPSLLTVRAVELLRCADVVAHDELVSESILALIPRRAELLAVGRRGGAGETPYRLHPEVLARARRGQFVVRLKAGDPLVFGRGGEEAEDLTRAGIPFEIVPGITAALGAAASAGIPLTHRNLAAQIVVSTGHLADGGTPPPDSLAGRTLVLYMAAHELRANLAAIVAGGWSPSTPAALVMAATTADERTVIGTLATLAARVEAQRAGRAALPALLLVGSVVGARQGVAWRMHLPLRGRRVLLARARSGPSGLATALRRLGAEVLELPHVEPLEHEGLEGLEELEELEAPRERLVEPARWPSRVDLVVLPGPAAARALYAMAPLHVREALTVAVGARTEAAARGLGVRAVLRGGDGTREGVVRVVVEALGEREKERESGHGHGHGHEENEARDGKAGEFVGWVS